jgi:hypothetical protein
MQPLIDNAFATRMKATYVTGGDGDHLTVVPGPASDVGGQLIEWVTHLVEVRFGGGDDEHIDVAVGSGLAPGERPEHRDVRRCWNEMVGVFTEAVEERLAH